MKLPSKMHSNWMDLISKDDNSRSRENGSINQAWQHEEDAVVAAEEEVVEAAVVDITIVVEVDGVEEEEEDAVVDIVEAFGDADEVVSEDGVAVDTIRITD